MKIEIEGNSYELDVDAGKTSGVLKKLSNLHNHKFEAGDVFVPTGKYCNPFLLIQVIWTDYCKWDTARSWQLLGMGCIINSGAFFEEHHTIDEIKEYLISHNMEYRENINYKIQKLVEP